MSEAIVMPATSTPQNEAWHAVFDLHERHPANWSLIGGQMVQLHCVERESPVVRPTDDADAVLNVRAEPLLLAAFTATLRDLGFDPETTGDGLQHRWLKGEAQIDVLLPEGIGEKAAARTGIKGAPTLTAPGTTQALHRTEIVNDQHGRSRHCEDFVILCGLITGRDLRAQNMGDNPLTKTQRSTLRKMVEICRTDDHAQTIPNWDANLQRLERAARL